MLTCPRSSLSFHSNAHHHGSLPQQLGVVWDLLLKADPEGPSPIFHAALRPRFHTHTGTPLHVSLQHTLVEIVATDATLAHRYRLLTSMPGVGPVLACTLIALLPELGGMSRKQVAALVGVAPYAFESGTLKGRRCIWGGRANVRQVLYMAAMSASNWNPALKLFHDRLKGAGKLPKVVIVAVMWEMITTINAMVRDDISWAGPLCCWHRRTTA